MRNQKKAYLYAALTVLFWSTIASAFEISLRYLDVVVLLFYASLVSTLVLLIYLALSGKLTLLATVSKKDCLRSAMLGFLNPFLYYMAVIKAYDLLPAQQAQPINFVWPITLVLLSIPLLKQKLRPRDMLAIAISFFGVLVVSTEGNVLGFRFTNSIGAALALGSSFVWALFWIYNTRDNLDAAVRLFLNFIFGSVYIFAAMALLAKVRLPDFNGLLGAAYIGAFEMGITFLLWLRALRLSAKTAHVANLIFLVPFFSLALVSVVVGERIVPATVVGLLFIVGGIVLQKLPSTPHSPRPGTTDGK